jgi:hypothetical protein
MYSQAELATRGRGRVRQQQQGKMPSALPSENFVCSLHAVDTDAALVSPLHLSLKL